MTFFQFLLVLTLMLMAAGAIWAAADFFYSRTKNPVLKRTLRRLAIFVAVVFIGLSFLNTEPNADRDMTPSLLSGADR